MHHERGVCSICETLDRTTLLLAALAIILGLFGSSAERLFRASAVCNVARNLHRGVALAEEKHSALAYGAYTAPEDPWLSSIGPVPRPGTVCPGSGSLEGRPHPEL